MLRCVIGCMPCKHWAIAGIAQVPCEYICLIWHDAQAPKQSVIDASESFMTEVLPEFEALDFPATRLRTATAGVRT